MGTWNEDSFPRRKIEYTWRVNRRERENFKKHTYSEVFGSGINSMRYECRSGGRKMWAQRKTQDFKFNRMG